MYYNILYKLVLEYSLFLYKHRKYIGMVLSYNYTYTITIILVTKFNFKTKITLSFLIMHSN